jgi:hypothetical protein
MKDELRLACLALTMVICSISTFYFGVFHGRREQQRDISSLAYWKGFTQGATCGMLACQRISPDKYAKAYLPPPPELFWARVYERRWELFKRQWESKAKFTWQINEVPNLSWKFNYIKDDQPESP